MRSVLATSRVEMGKLRDVFGYYDRKGQGQGKKSDTDKLDENFYQQCTALQCNLTTCTRIFFISAYLCVICHSNPDPNVLFSSPSSLLSSCFSPFPFSCFSFLLSSCFFCSSCFSCLLFLHFSYFFPPIFSSLLSVREEDLGIVFEEAGARLRKTEVEALADRFSVGNRGMCQYRKRHLFPSLLKF